MVWQASIGEQSKLTTIIDAAIAGFNCLEAGVHAVENFFIRWWFERKNPQWRRWYAWRPVLIERSLVAFENVERIYGPRGWQHRSYLPWMDSEHVGEPTVRRWNKYVDGY
jgi:hypothetical protein